MIHPLSQLLTSLTTSASDPPHEELDPIADVDDADYIAYMVSGYHS